MNTYLPASVRLPFGYTIRIRVVGARTLRRIAQASVDGCWDVDHRTVYVDRALPEAQQRYVLTHELIHAFADFQHHALGGASQPAR